MLISVVIPVYKKIEMFLVNLSNNLPYLKNCELIIVNDDPSQSLKNYLAEYPNIVLIENSRNLGFSGAANIGVKQARSRYVMLLNSDVILTDDNYLSTRVLFMKQTDLFAISFAQKEKNGQVVGKNIFYWKDGFFHHQKAKSMTPGITAWAEGGSCIIDKKKFIELDGFDEVYSPFYWEDVDLSYRAWKLGYRIYFEPKIKVIHYHQGTINDYYQKNKIKTIAYRNQLLFIWKNITAPDLKKEHFCSLVKRTFGSLLKGDHTFLNGLWQAYKLKDNLNYAISKEIRNDYETMALFQSEKT